MYLPHAYEIAEVSALVAHIPGSGAQGPAYLRMTDDGESQWVSDPSAATCFHSLREATRLATRLPRTLRAFGIPRRV